MEKKFTTPIKQDNCFFLKKILAPSFDPRNNPTKPKCLTTALFTCLCWRCYYTIYLVYAFIISLLEA